MSSGCRIVSPTLVYAWPQTKVEFDQLAIPEVIHEWKPCETTTLIKHDGHQWETRCHSKTIDGDVMVVFQWADERQINTTV